MDLTNETIRMAGALVAVIALLVGGLVMIRRFLGGSSGVGGDLCLRPLGGLRLGQGKSLLLVEVAGEVLVLGSSPKELQLFMRVRNPEHVEQLRAQHSGGLHWLTGGTARQAIPQTTRVPDTGESS